MERVIHSPEAHIPIACVTAESGVIYLRFKKSREKIFETMTLDQFIYLIVLALNNEWCFLSNQRYAFGYDQQ